MNTEADNNQYTNLASVIFWLVWIAALLFLPFYGFTFLFEVGSVTPSKQSSMFSPIIGGVVFILQIVIMIFAVKAYQSRQPLSKLYLILLGGSVLNLFVWAGGCALMGPLQL